MTTGSFQRPDDGAYKERLWESFAVSLGLHISVFLAGYVGLTTQAEYGMAGAQAMSAASAPPVEVLPDTVDFLAEDDSAPVEKKKDPTSVPTPARQKMEGEHRKGGAYEIPSYLMNPPPPYPEQARQQGQEGLVLLRVEVDATGEVTSVTVRQSSGFELLDAAAIGTVGTWRFKPGRLAGIAVSTTVDVPVRFQLKNGRP